MSRIAHQPDIADSSMTRYRLAGRRLAPVAFSALVALGSVACSSSQSLLPPAPSGTSGSPTTTVVSADGTLAVPGQASNAITYNPAMAPTGARLALTLTSSSGYSKAKFDASGLLPNRGYAVHLHTRACGPIGEAAGPHFQHDIDPAATAQQPSSNPAYANPDNEIWLDVQTDANGAATSTTQVPFVFTDRVPGSVVVHENPVTGTVAGQAGKAGARLACLSLTR